MVVRMPRMTRNIAVRRSMVASFVVGMFAFMG